MEAKKILEAILEGKLLISYFRDAICLSLCLISDNNSSSISEVLK